MTKSPGVPQARHLAERSVAPFLRADVHDLGIDHGLTVLRLGDLEIKVEGLLQTIAATHGAMAALESHQPTILNAIASTNGTTRLLARQTESLRTDVAQFEMHLAELGSQQAERANELMRSLEAGNRSVLGEMRPHIEMIAWLLQRVETVRAEMMHELRYGAAKTGDGAAQIETKIVNPASLDTKDLRINFGAGHIALEGFVNVDMRELPGIDVVAPVDGLPFEPSSLAEIFSSHTVEHFPELELRRKLLPYWVSLLRPGGTFRAIVPDLEAMSKAYVKGTMSFDVLRSVIYGGQEYEGDFHFTGFTPNSLGALLVEAGLQKPRVIAKGRQNGDCLEFEISASKPSK